MVVSTNEAQPPTFFIASGNHKVKNGKTGHKWLSAIFCVGHDGSSLSLETWDLCCESSWKSLCPKILFRWQPPFRRSPGYPRHTWSRKFVSRLRSLAGLGNGRPHVDATCDDHSLAVLCFTVDLRPNGLLAPCKHAG